MSASPLPTSRHDESGPDADPPRRERRKEARPGELLDAALDLFVGKGFAATRAEEVAARAGVSKGTLFLYFQSKEELFKALVREHISGRLSAWNQEFEAFEGSTAEMLRYSMREWWERIGATKGSGVTKLIFSEASNFPDIAAYYQQEVIEPGQDLIRRILQRGIDRGEFHIDDLDAAVFAVIAPMVQMILMKHAMGACLPCGFATDPGRVVAAQTELLLRGLMTRPGTPTPKSPS